MVDVKDLIDLFKGVTPLAAIEEMRQEGQARSLKMQSMRMELDRARKAQADSETLANHRVADAIRQWEGFRADPRRQTWGAVGPQAAGVDMPPVPGFVSAGKQRIGPSGELQKQHRDMERRSGIYRDLFGRLESPGAKALLADEMEQDLSLEVIGTDAGRLRDAVSMAVEAEVLPPEQGDELSSMLDQLELVGDDPQQAAALAGKVRDLFGEYKRAYARRQTVLQLHQWSLDWAQNALTSSVESTPEEREEAQYMLNMFLADVGPDITPERVREFQQDFRKALYGIKDDPHERQASAVKAALQQMPALVRELGGAATLKASDIAELLDRLVAANLGIIGRNPMVAPGTEGVLPPVGGTGSAPGAPSQDPQRNKVLDAVVEGASPQDPDAGASEVPKMTLRKGEAPQAFLERVNAVKGLTREQRIKILEAAGLKPEDFKAKGPRLPRGAGQGVK